MKRSVHKKLIGTNLSSDEQDYSMPETNKGLHLMWGPLWAPGPGAKRARVPWPCLPGWVGVLWASQWGSCSTGLLPGKWSGLKRELCSPVTWAEPHWGQAFRSLPPRIRATQWAGKRGRTGQDFEQLASDKDKEKAQLTVQYIRQPMLPCREGK